MSADNSPKHTNKSSAEDHPPSMSMLAGAGVAGANSATQLQQQAQLTSFPFTTRELLREDEMHEVLQLSSSQVSQATASNASALVQLSNSEKSHERLQQLLPLYFYSWNLTDAHSVIVFLLLHYFLLKREHKEVLGAKGLYEEHIALLKSRMSDLEEKLSNSHSHSGSSCGSSPRNGNIGGGGGVDQVLAREVESLRNLVESLKSENDQLKRSNEEVCQINEQWALDYQSLSDQVKNATGFYSVQSGGSSAHSSARASPVPASMLTQNCLQCSQMELQLEAKQEEIRATERQVEDIKSELKKSELQLERREKDIDRLNNEHHAILLQLQEIGDLQAAVKMKHDYRKLQFQLSQTNKQYQEAVSEKLQFQKQVEKLRQAFLGIFPFTSVAPQNAVHSTSEGYSSFPMRTCRRQHHNQYPFSDPAPPTPPGLIARGDHHGSLVEKDEHSLSSQPVHPSLPKQQHHTTSDDQTQTCSLRPILQSHDSHVTSTLNKSPHDYQRHSTTYSNSTNESHGSHVIKQHQLVVPAPESGPPSIFTPNTSRSSSSNSMYDPNSRGHLTTSDYSSSKSLPHHGAQLSTHPSSSSQQTSFTGYSSTHTTSSGLSSGSVGMMTTRYHQAPPMIHTSHSPSQSLMAGHPAYYSSNGGALSVGKGSLLNSSTRPTSLTITRPPGLGIQQQQQPASMTSSLHLQNQQQKVLNQQKFECPSCRKQFPYGPQDFDRWFEHIRYCENKPKVIN